MKVKKFLSMFGNTVNCSFKVHWNLEEGKDEERYIETDCIEAVEELFGDWNVAEEDALFLTPETTKEEKVVIDLYVHKPRGQNIPIVNLKSEEDEKEFLCPQCGAVADSEDLEEVKQIESELM